MKTDDADPNLTDDRHRVPSDRFLGGPLSRRRFLVGGMGAAASLALAACGGSNSGASSALTTSSGATPPVGGTPVRGGRLRVGFVGNGSAETLNATQACFADVDVARAAMLFDGLVSFPDRQGNVHPMLAESLERNSDATEWTIRLRSSVTWHDGSPLVADDVMYWLNYIANPKSGACLSFVPALFMDLKRLKKLDNLTVRVPLTRPVANLPAMLSQEGNALIKRDTRSFSRPLGTGPFVFDSWTPGQSSLFKRNANYWQRGLPYVDELELVSISDDAARVNALLGGQVDCAINVPYPQAKAYLAQGASSPINILVTSGNSENYFNMFATHKPFNDVRVRQAFRLMIDRPAMLQTANDGLGEVLNDLWGKGWPRYDPSIPQRTQDIETAKSLLKQAGYDNDLAVTLTTAPGYQGAVEAATVLASQAPAAGVKVNLRKLTPQAFGQHWPWPFGYTPFSAAPLEYFYATTQLPGAPFPDTQWQDPKMISLVEQALADTNPATAEDKWNALQRYDWNYGAQIHWGNMVYTDGLSKKVHGALPETSTWYSFGGLTFAKYWLE